MKARTLHYPVYDEHLIFGNEIVGVFIEHILYLFLLFLLLTLNSLSNNLIQIEMNVANDIEIRNKRIIMIIIDRTRATNI